MAIAPLSLRKDYWEDFSVTDQDLDYLYNFLLEVEKPQTVEELLKALVAERVRIEKEEMQKQQRSGGAIYYPKEHYQIGQKIQIPVLDWQAGTVTATWPGSNPEYPPFEVIEVQFNSGEKRQYA